MKKSLFAFLAVSLVAILVLGSCSSGATTAPEVQDTQAAGTTDAVIEAVTPEVQDTQAASTSDAEVEAVTPEVQDTQAASLTDAQMEALITEKVHDKHSLAFILQQNKTAEEWSETIDRMIGYGAKITPEEKALIIEWLVNRNK